MRPSKTALLLALLFWLAGATLQAAERRAAGKDTGLMLRMKVRPIPQQPIQIRWRTAGEGLGGDVISGSILLSEAAAAPGTPRLDSAAPGDPDSFDKLLFDAGATTTVANSDKELFLKPDTWTTYNPVSKLRRGFLTFTFRGLTGPIESVAAEFEFSQGGKVLKSFVEQGVLGPTVGIRLPGGEPESEGWLDQLLGLSGYVERRARSLEDLPWGGGPLPTRFTFITDCGGFGEGAGYGIRHTNPEILATEARILRQLGINSLRGGFARLQTTMSQDPVYGPHFGKRREVHASGYPVISMGLSDGNKSKRNLPVGAGCPFYPGTDDNARAAAQQAVADLLAHADGAEQMWGLTVDEIGSVFDRTPEGKPHMSVCPHCAIGFRNWLKSLGMTPQDFARNTWEEIRPNLYPNAELWADVEARMVAAEQANVAQAQGQMLLDTSPAKAASDLDPLDDPAPAKADTAEQTAGKKQHDRPAAKAAALVDLDSVNEEDADAQNAQGAARAKAQPASSAAPVDPAQALLRQQGEHRLQYWSHRFNCYASARLFGPLREACETANTAKAKAVADGRLDAPEAKQALVRTFALRGCTFISGGHSLDYFNFYREADTAFVYETSNRDGRIWQWDSMVGDVARSLQRMRALPFGIYIKPHRGAPVQRLLSSVGRGAQLIFWYTYGPDYAKGDSFSSAEKYLHEVSRGVHLIGAAEEVLYGAAWSEPARVAHVRTLTAEKFASPADWENGKWVYSALNHAHLPVDELDEEMLISSDLSPYKAIYISGGYLRQAAAQALVGYVQQGGVLYLDGGGAMVDEAGAALDVLLPVLGLKQRAALQTWATTGRYGATSLQPITPLPDVQPPSPQAQRVEGSGPKDGHGFAGSFTISVAREVLHPVQEARVLARFGDGQPAAVIHSFGKGTAYTVGFFAGLEYAAPILTGEYDMTRDLNADRRAFVATPALTVATPVVDAAAPTVEGLLVRQPQSGKRAVLLMNWTYQGRRALHNFDKLNVRIRTAEPVTQVRSLWHNQIVPIVNRDDQSLTVQLPQLEDGDVLLLE